MTRFARTALFAAMTVAGALSATGAGAAPPSAAPMLGAAADPSLVEEVRYVTRCRPVYVDRRDRFGRPVRVTRQQCSRVWVGGRGGRDRY